MDPNFITALRILVAPVFAYAFIVGYRAPHSAPWLLVALGILVIIELSDALDGHVARMTGKVSDFGKFFDPVADSVSRLTVFAAFLMAGAMPLWMFLVFLYRDTFVQGIRYLCIKQGTVVPARVSGKLKAILQAIGSFGVTIVPVLREHFFPSLPRQILGHDTGAAIMLIPALFTAYSAVDYWMGTQHVVQKALGSGK